MPQREDCEKLAASLAWTLASHGAALVDEIERRARQDPAFAKVLRSVWLDHGALPSEVEARLEKWVRGPKPG